MQHSFIAEWQTHKERVDEAKNTHSRFHANHETKFRHKEILGGEKHVIMT